MKKIVLSLVVGMSLISNIFYSNDDCLKKTKENLSVSNTEQSNCKRCEWDTDCEQSAEWTRNQAQKLGKLFINYVNPDTVHPLDDSMALDYGDAGYSIDGCEQAAEWTRNQAQILGEFFINHVNPDTLHPLEDSMALDYGDAGHLHDGCEQAADWTRDDNVQERQGISKSNYSVTTITVATAAVVGAVGALGYFVKKYWYEPSVDQIVQETLLQVSSEDQQVAVNYLVTHVPALKNNVTTVLATRSFDKAAVSACDIKNILDTVGTLKTVDQQKVALALLLITAKLNKKNQQVIGTKLKSL